jgi:hypothetical protein
MGSFWRASAEHVAQQQVQRHKVCCLIVVRVCDQIRTSCSDRPLHSDLPSHNDSAANQCRSLPFSPAGDERGCAGRTTTSPPSPISLSHTGKRSGRLFAGTAQTRRSNVVPTSSGSSPTPPRCSGWPARCSPKPATNGRSPTNATFRNHPRPSQTRPRPRRPMRCHPRRYHGIG